MLSARLLGGSHLEGFGFCTFDSSLAAFLCLTVLNGYETHGSKILVKAGNKEQGALDEVRRQQALTADSQAALEIRLHELRESLAALLQIPDAPETNEQINLEEGSGKADDAQNVDDFFRDIISKREGKTDPVSEGEASHAAGDSNSNPAPALAPQLPPYASRPYVPSYHPNMHVPLAMMSDGGPYGEIEEDPAVIEDIKKFRMKQALKDKENEDMRKQKLEQKLRTIAAQREEKKREEKESKEDKKSKDGVSAETGGRDARGKEKGRSRSRSRERDSRREYQDVEASRRRKREVLERLGLDADDAPDDTEATDSSAAAQPLKLGLQLQAKTKTTKRAFTARFEDEDEQAHKRTRELIPIDYTEEERLAGMSVNDKIAHAVGRMNPGASQTQTDPAAVAPSEKVKKIADMIPQDNAKLFGYALDWQLLEQNDVIDTKIKPWIVKKVIQYMGQEETMFIQFVCEKLKMKATAQELLGEVGLVLDNEAEQFVLNLWRMLVFNQLKLQGH